MSLKRVLLLAGAAYTVRWAARALASHAGHRWLPPGPPPRESMRPPGWMPGHFR